MADRDSLTARASNGSATRQGGAHRLRRKSTKKSSKFASDSDDSEDDSSSETDSASGTDKEDESSSLEPSNVTMNKSRDEVLRNEILEDIFPQIQTELLLVVSYETIIFLENGKRDSILLEIKHEDLLYVMGKKDTLKIGFQTNNDQFHGF